MQIGKYTYINKMSDSYNHIITSVEAGNGLDKIQHPSTMKALNKLGLGESSPSNNGYV